MLCTHCNELHVILEENLIDLGQVALGHFLDLLLGGVDDNVDTAELLCLEEHAMCHLV